MRSLTIVLGTFVMCHHAIANTEPMTITVVDEQQQAMDVDIIRWWYTESPQQKNYLSCVNDDCNQWQITETLQAEAIVHATASRIHDADPMCSHVYSGQLTLIPATTSPADTPVEDSQNSTLATQLILKHAGLVCQ